MGESEQVTMSAPSSPTPVLSVSTPCTPVASRASCHGAARARDRLNVHNPNTPRTPTTPTRIEGEEKCPEHDGKPLASPVWGNRTDQHGNIKRACGGYSMAKLQQWALLIDSHNEEM